MTMKKIIPVVIAVLFFAGCQNNDPVFDYNLKSAVVIETNNNFGLNLLKEVLLNETEPNVMISPVSVSLALGMAYNGSDSTTKEAFEDLFYYSGLTREEVNSITKELIDVLTTNSTGNLLEIANSVWYQEGFPVLQGFIDLNTQYYDAGVFEQDFSASDAVDNINDWVSDKTHKKISKIIDQLDPATKMILINALYFNCLWEVEFDPGETVSKPFHNEDGSTYKNVEMMTVENDFKYSINDDVSIVELPYKNSKFSMLLFLPSENSSLDEFIEKLDGDNWNTWINSLGSASKLQVVLPKYKFSYERSLADDLKNMGLEIAFTDSADFSGMSTIPLWIFDVIHKTYIDVNEEGTEAAVVTAITLGNDMIEFVQAITFDRPFFFAIKENSSNAIVFAGKVSEPEYEE